MEIIYLNKVSRQPRINLVPEQQFYSKTIPVTQEVKDAITKITKDYEQMEVWMKKTYDAFLPNRQEQVPDFPPELLNGKEPQKTKPSQKGRAKKRVRDGSSGDATSSGGAV